MTEATEDDEGAIPTTSSYEDDETATRAEVDPDPSIDSPDRRDDRAVTWRPGRRQSGTTQAPEDEEKGTASRR